MLRCRHPQPLPDTISSTIRQLVEHSGKAGTLEPGMQRQLSGLIDLGTIPVAALLAEGADAVWVGAQATAADVRAAGHASGHMRVLMEGRGDAPRVVHVRDTLLLADDQPVEAVARAAHVLSPATPVYEALSRMRASSVQLSVVMDGKTMLGVITLSDIIKRVLPSSMTLAAGE